METGRFLFGRRVRTIQLQLEGSLKRSVLKLSPPKGWRQRGRRGVQMAHGNEDAAAHLRVCSTLLPSTRFSTHELRHTSFRPSLRRCSNREHRLAS